MTFWLIEDIWSVCWRELKRFSRQKARIITTMAQSIIWLVFMSNIFARVTSLPGFPASSYLEYMTPGIVVMSTMFGGVFGGLSIVWDRRFGFLNKMLAAPLNRSSIPIGKMLATAVISGFQSSVILSIALFMGVRFVTGTLGTLLAILISMLLCLMLSGISLTLGAAIKTHETLMAVTNFLTMPMMFTSSAFFPLEYMPSWLASIARWNPLTYALEAIRTLMLKGWEWMVIASDVMYLLTLTVALTVVATVQFRRSVS